jgi:hypothetical protein
VLRIFTISLLLSLYNLSGKSQVITAAHLIETAKVPRQKFESYIVKQNFAFVGNDFKGDTIIREYVYRQPAKAKKDSVNKSLSYFSTKEDISYSLTINSADDGKRLIKEFKKEGFFCNSENDTSSVAPMLYQHNDYSVLINTKPVDTFIAYTFLIRKQEMPKPKDIKFAEDLFVFSSHEQLRYYFGDENVKKDIYYLADNKKRQCTIIFANTGRQAVFLWDDELNNCRLSKIYIGGQLHTGGAIDYDKNVAENLWQLKSGVHPGMSLYTLRVLNDASFNFYGGNNVNTGMIFTDSTGKINFKKDNIILGCMNCNDNRFKKQTVINSDEALSDERILFVHTIILDPDKEKQKEN